MRLKNFRKMVFDCHLSLCDKYGREVAYISEITGDTKKYDDCVVLHVQAIEYRLLKVTIYREKPRLVKGESKR